VGRNQARAVDRDRIDSRHTAPRWWRGRMRRNRRASRRSSITSCPSAGGGLGLINDAALISPLPRYALERIRAPTLVMSVADDRFGTYDGARYTAEHVPGARFIGYASRTRGARCDAAPAAPAARSSLRPRPRLHVVWVGVLMAALANSAHWQTMVFTVLGSRNSPTSSPSARTENPSSPSGCSPTHRSPPPSP
jgi:hypothetical protein